MNELLAKTKQSLCTNSKRRDASLTDLHDTHQKLSTIHLSDQVSTQDNQSSKIKLEQQLSEMNKRSSVLHKALNKFQYIANGRILGNIANLFTFREDAKPYIRALHVLMGAHMKVLIVEDIQTANAVLQVTNFQPITLIFGLGQKST